MCTTRRSKRLIQSTAVRPGLSLIETLVVSGIMAGFVFGVLVPQLVESQDVARRVSCADNMRQLGQALLNHESAFGFFPSGGVEPWPEVEHYSANGIPFGPKQQGLGWHYQILPFLPKGPVDQPVTVDGLQALGPEVFFCPARDRPHRRSTKFRGETFSHWMTDYGAIQATPSRAQEGDERFGQLLADELGCRVGYAFWGRKSQAPGGMDFDPLPAQQLGPQYAGFWGVIVRGSYHRVSNGVYENLGYEPLTRLATIKDGVANTAMVTEKYFFHINFHPAIRDSALPLPHDDRGWSDGYGLDTMRTNLCSPALDGTIALGYGDWTRAGSPHPSGVNTVLADGRVRQVSYGIDLETWHRLGHRRDGAIRSQSRKDVW